MQQPLCTLCGGRRSLVWQEGDYRALLCSDCGVTESPRDLSPAFEGQYFEHYLVSLERAAPRIRHFRRMAAALPPEITPPILDVGAGMGFFARALPDALRQGMTVLEPSNAARGALAGIPDVRVVPDFGTLSPGAPEYRTATLWDVLAHVQDPAEILRQVRTRLEAGGLLVIKTPHHPVHLFRVAKLLSPLGGSRALLHIPSMRFHFTPGSIKNLLLRSGFSVEGFRWVPEPPPLRGFLGSLKGLVLRGVKRTVVLHPSFLIWARRA